MRDRRRRKKKKEERCWFQVVRFTNFSVDVNYSCVVLCTNICVTGAILNDRLNDVLMFQWMFSFECHINWLSSAYL